MISDKRSIINKTEKNELISESGLEITPAIKFSGDKVEPISTADLPEQSFGGRNFIELKFNIKDPNENLIEKIFKPEFYPNEGLRSKPPQPSVNLEYIKKAMEQGYADKTLFPHVGEYAGYIRSVVNSNNKAYETVSNLPLSPKLVKLQPEDVFAALKAGKSLMIYRSTSGLLDYELINSSVGKGDATLVSLKRSASRRFAASDNPNIFFTSIADGDILYGPPGFLVSTEGSVIFGFSQPFISSVKVQLGSNPAIDAEQQWILDHNGIVFNARIPAITEGMQPLTVVVKYRTQLEAPELEMKGSINITTSFAVLIADDGVTLPFPNDLRPRLFLIERYRLSSYLGTYGAGRTLKTFTLLPGEKTKISTRTYTKTVEQRKQASSILDSITDESTKDFENTLATEQSNKSAYEETFSYEVNGKAEASWGWGSAEVSGGVKGGTNSSREEFAKNVSNATQKHVSKASSKRDVEINTSYEMTAETETEASIEREIQNINVSRTLNFVFRQMNQEFITILHLIDIRVAFWNGDSNPLTFKKIEVPLPELNSLLRQVLVNDNDPNALTIHKEVHKAIIDEITNIRDYNYDDLKPDENGQPFLNEVKIELVSDPSPVSDPIMSRNYWRINKKYRSKYVDGPTNITNIPGVMMSVDRNVIRTEGVIVESILGKGLALDDYSSGLQIESIRKLNLENSMKEAEIDKTKLAIEIVSVPGQGSPVDRFKTVFPCCQPTIYSVWPPKDKDNKKGELANKDEIGQEP
jgi:hypothetical protein